MKQTTPNLYLYIIVFFMFTQCFSPGSYPYAERYELTYSKNELIIAIRNFKKNNPSYNPPSNLHLKDGHRNPSDHWYHIYFYYQEENEIIKTWIRQSENNVFFAFVAVNKGTILGNWKEINKDYPSSENIIKKKEFETRILKEIKKTISVQDKNAKITNH